MQASGSHAHTLPGEQPISDGMNPSFPNVTVIIPCRNESIYLDSLFESLASQTYPQSQLEILFIDGMSIDDTCQRIEAFAAAHPSAKLLKNPRRIVPHAMNIGITHASGEYIIRMDAHAYYVPTYISVLIAGALQYQTDNIGCVFQTAPRIVTAKSVAIAFALSHPLGVGNSLFRIGITAATEADTVPFGCFRRETLRDLGGYDVRLKRNQDIELNRRLLRRGGRIILLPNLGGVYHCRETFRELWKNNWGNGKWAIYTAKLTRTLKSLSVRHFVPLAFCIYLAVAFPLLTLSAWFAAPIFAYMLAIASVAIRQFLPQRKLAAMLCSLAAFPVLHLSYGLGSLAALLTMFRHHEVSNDTQR